MAAAARALRVLVVDDDVDTVDTSALLLQLDGHEVQTASNGGRTLERAAAFRPHLILLDIGMPGMDGYEVGRRIQGLSLPARLYLAAVTGYGWQDDKRRSAEAGFDLHLTKPVELETLRGLLSLLKGSSQIKDESPPFGISGADWRFRVMLRLRAYFSSSLRWPACAWMLRLSGRRVRRCTNAPSATLPGHTIC